MNIGFNIKKLRRERDITQEQLAEYLNISVSAISQWESGKTTPDISLLAPLANIFDVTSDVLLGIDVINKEKQIDDIIFRAEKYNRDDNDREKTVSTLREGLKEYPNSYKIMERLMIHLISERHGKSTDEVLIVANEAIQLGEKILAECTDDRIRIGASYNLCYAYPEIGMTEKAIELAKKLPHTNVAREQMLVQLYEGEEKREQYRENIQLYFGHLIMNMGNYNGIENDIIISKKIVNLIEVMIEDGNYGYFGLAMFGCHSAIALDYAKSNDYDKAIENLQLSSDNAIKIDTEYAGFNTEYTSLLLKGTPTIFSFYNDINFSMQLLEQMKHTAFDPIRENADFIEIEKNLKKYAKNR